MALKNIKDIQAFATSLAHLFARCFLPVHPKTLLLQLLFAALPSLSFSTRRFHGLAKKMCRYFLLQSHESFFSFHLCLAFLTACLPVVSSLPYGGIIPGDTF